MDDTDERRSLAKRLADAGGDEAWASTLPLSALRLVVEEVEERENLTRTLVGRWGDGERTRCAALPLPKLRTYAALMDKAHPAEPLVQAESRRTLEAWVPNGTVN